jgi:cytochrome oxidase Cu insertion factor (SCO1/SenC/PrrC family)
VRPIALRELEVIAALTILAALTAPDTAAKADLTPVNQAAPINLASPFPHAARVFLPRLDVPNLPLVQQDGRRFELNDLKGRWVWLYFGYTNCPDACPLTLGYLASEFRLLAHPERVQPVFCSVDPLRDTPDRLVQYVHYFHPAFLGVSGREPELRALTRALGTRYVLEAPEKPGGAYVVDHPDLVFLLDPDGHLTATYKPDALVGGGALAADLDATVRAQTPAEPGRANPPGQPNIGAQPDFDTGAAWCGTATGTEALMTRMHTLGSGTSVLPAAAPMRMVTWQQGDWSLMTQGMLVLGDNVQGGPRGNTRWAGENNLMLMATRPWGRGLLDLHLMGSLEPLTIPPGGTPQLFQLGGSYQEAPIVDAAHPQPWLMELAARYTWNLDTQTALFLYGGPIGEPALGPTTYMHRPSAAENRWAPLGHHMQDSTHVSDGVATVGAKKGDFQLELSAFNGREPGESALQFSLGPLDSYATRLSWFPGANWVFQTSLGRLHDQGANMIAMAPMPGMTHLGDDLRVTASALNVLATAWGPLSTQLIWGETRALSGLEATEQSYGLESELDGYDNQHYYGRYELADRVGFAANVPRVSALTLGYLRDLPLCERVALGWGADATVYSQDSQLIGIYGANPLSFRVYLRLAPPMLLGAGGMGTMMGQAR